MLNTKAIDSAYVPAQALDQRNISLAPAAGTPLAALVSLTHLDHNPVKNEDGFYIDLQTMATVTNQGDPIMGFSEHTATMEDVSTFLAEKLSGHIFRARTVVAPFVDAYAARLNESLGLIEGNPDNGVEVEIYKTPAPFMEPSLVDSFMRSNDVTMFSPELDMQLPELGDNEILTLMQTGAASVDAAVLEHFSKLPQGWLASKWKQIYCQDLSGIRLSGGLGVHINGRQNVDTALFVFLTARRMWNSPIEGTNMPLDKFENMMCDYRDQAALRLCQEAAVIHREDKAGFLIREISGGSLGRKIVVNDVPYREWLKNGGTNEALMGNALRGHPFMTSQDLLDNRTILEQTWERHYGANKALYEQRTFLRMRQAVMVEYDALVLETSEEDFPIQERAVARALLLKMHQALTISDFDDLSMLALRLICRSRFWNTDAEQILEGIARAKKSHPSIDTREAANISVRQYVARWIATMIRPQSANPNSVF